MGEEEQGTEGNCCASCGAPLPPGSLMCLKCSELKAAGRSKDRPSIIGRSEKTSGSRTPEECVRRGVYYGLLTEVQGEILLHLLSKAESLPFSVKSVLVCLVTEISEERHAKRREDRVYVLAEFVSLMMPSEDTTRRITLAFELR